MKVTKVGHFSGHKNSIYTITPSIHPDCFYSGASDGFVVEWNHLLKGDGELMVNVQKPVYSLFLQLEKQELLIGTATGNIHMVDLHTKKEVRNIEAHKLGVFEIKMLGEHIVTAGEDGFIHFWNKSDFTLQHSIHASEKSARVITFSDVRKEFAIGFSDHKIRIYNAETFELQKVLDDHTNSVFALAYSPQGRYLISGGRDAKLHIRACENNFELTLDIPAHTLHINHISFSPNGKLFATASMDKTIKIWDATTIELLKVIDKTKTDGHLSSVNRVFWLDNKRLLSCSDDKQIMMWEITQ